MGNIMPIELIHAKRKFILASIVFHSRTKDIFVYQQAISR
jgi:hypothetical protein